MTDSIFPRKQAFGSRGDEKSLLEKFAFGRNCLAAYKVVLEPNTPSSGHLMSRSTHKEYHCIPVTNVEEIDEYLCFRAVGTFARALDCSSSIRQPSLHMSAAAASRDITLVRLLTVHVL